MLRHDPHRGDDSPFERETAPELPRYSVSTILWAWVYVIVAMVFAGAVGAGIIWLLGT